MAAMSKSTPKTVLLLGDSFIQRLCVWATDNDKMNLNLDPTRVKVVWDGLGGMHVNRSAKKSIWQHTESVLMNSPSIVVLSIGSNDLGRVLLHQKQFVTDYWNLFRGACNRVFIKQWYCSCCLGMLIIQHLTIKYLLLMISFERSP